MAVLLDTSVLVDVDTADLGSYAGADILLSAITIGELSFGLDSPDRDARERRLRAVIATYEVLPFGVEEAKLYGVLASLVRAAGRNARPRRLDLQIAATAAAARLPLLTSNPCDFVGVERLVDVVSVTRAV